jgi:hypothetical protein
MALATTARGADLPLRAHVLRTLRLERDELTSGWTWHAAVGPAHAGQVVQHAAADDAAADHHHARMRFPLRRLLISATEQRFGQCPGVRRRPIATTQVTAALRPLSVGWRYAQGDRPCRS